MKKQRRVSGNNAKAVKISTGARSISPTVVGVKNNEFVIA